MFYDLIELTFLDFRTMSTFTMKIVTLPMEYSVLMTHVVRVGGSISVKTLSLNQLLWTGTTDEWKALKCQTLGAAVHVIVLVCWLEIDHCLVTLSCLPCALFCSCPCKVCSWVSDALSQTGLVQLIFSFPSWFHTVWFYCSHTFHS